MKILKSRWVILGFCLLGAFVSAFAFREPGPQVYTSEPERPFVGEAIIAFEGNRAVRVKVWGPDMRTVDEQLTDCLARRRNAALGAKELSEAVDTTQRARELLESTEAQAALAARLYVLNTDEATRQKAAQIYADCLEALERCDVTITATIREAEHDFSEARDHLHPELFPVRFEADELPDKIADAMARLNKLKEEQAAAKRLYEPLAKLRGAATVAGVQEGTSRQEGSSVEFAKRLLEAQN